MLNGDDLSFAFGVGIGASVVASVRNPREIGLFPIFGFSALLTGGGGGLNVDSRLSSPDLRGGGGEGGWEEGKDGDFLGSRRGV